MNFIQTNPLRDPPEGISTCWSPRSISYRQTPYNLLGSGQIGKHVYLHEYFIPLFFLFCANSPHDESRDSSKGSRGMYFADFLYTLPVNSDFKSLCWAAAPNEDSGYSSKGFKNILSGELFLSWWIWWFVTVTVVLCN